MVTSQIARHVAELRKLDDKHSKFLFWASYYHDMGKGILEKYSGSHKVSFERCLEELEKVGLETDDESKRIVAHLILRHHYTSKKDILKLSEISVPVDVNADVLLRMLRFCDHLASIESVNHALLGELCRLGSPLELFAYTISLEGLVAGKIMDLTDEVLMEEGGKGIFYHNGSIFLFERGKSPRLDVVRSKMEAKLRSYFKNEIFDVKKIIGINDLGKTIIAPIDSLNSQNFESAWQRIMDKFDKRRQPRRGESIDNAIDKAYKLVQCAVAEIFKHFEEGQYSLKSPKITLNLPRDIFSPIIEELKKLGSAKMVTEFTRWSSEDMITVGKVLQKYIENKEGTKGITAKDFSEEALEMVLQLLTFSGEKPFDVERFCQNWYNSYVQVASEKSIGKEGQKEFCYICGYPTSFQFKEAISKKISISKIFSNRRPALASGIESVKICPVCLSEIKLLDSKLPADELESLLLVYLERPATVRPPYVEIKESFAEAISDISEDTNLRGYLKTMERMNITSETNERDFDPKYALGTNHFYVLFLQSPERRFGLQATVFILSPLVYRLVRNIGVSMRVDIGSSMDYAPIQRLLEIPPLARQYTNMEDFWKEMVYPSEIWMNLQVGNIVQFVKQFPKNWCHYFAKALQEEEGKVLSFVRSIYPTVKRVYGMEEKETFDLAMKVSAILRKEGYSRYAYTRPISIISSAILDAEKANFEEDAIIEYAVNRVLVLSSKEIGREIVKENVEKREDVKNEIHNAVKGLTRQVYSYYKNNGFKNFILLIRYISDAVYVESEFGGEESD
jgi:hypothetical protein